MCTNKGYITITSNGYFIDGQPTNYYRSELIRVPEKEYTSFVFTKFLHKQGIQEIHALTSKTNGTCLNAGNPSGKHGRNIWCRVKMIDGTIGNWIFAKKAADSKIAAFYCIKYCLDNIWECDLGKAILAKLKEQNTKIRN